MPEPVTLTAEEERILNEAEWMEEMLVHPGWMVLKARLEKGIEDIKRNKANIATSTWNQDPVSGQVNFEGNTSFEEIGRQYVRLEERRIGLQGVLDEPKTIIRQAKAIREKLGEAT